VSVLRVAGRVLVVGSTEEQVTLLAEVEDDELRTALAAATNPARAGTTGADPETGEPGRTALPARNGSGALAGSVLDRGTWTSVVQELRERTVRRS
jgi:flagellar protein FliO/FliZ